MGVVRQISPEAFDGFADALMGCPTQGLFATVEERIRPGGSSLALFGIYGLIVAIGNILLLVYFMSFLRILARLTGLTGARIWMTSVASMTVLAAVVGIGAFFQQSVLQGIGRCSEERATYRSAELPAVFMPYRAS